MASAMGDRMTVWDVATYLRVSRQRVEGVWRNAAYRFPASVLDSPRLWDRAQVEAWADAHWWGKQNWFVRRGIVRR